MGKLRISGCLLGLLLFWSCTNTSESTTDPHLVASGSSFVMEDGEEADKYYENREKFIEPYTTAEYNGDTLRVTTLHEINSCAETVGNIRFSNDTLYLLTEQQGDEACNSVVFVKFHYVIKKQGIENYHISY